MRTTSFLDALNDPDENQKMIKKLPPYLVNRWAREVDHWMNQDTPTSGYPPFSQFCSFIQNEARIACNPIISMRAFKAENESKYKNSAYEGRTRPYGSVAHATKTVPRSDE